ncbi:MAG: Ribose import ATP-binding protein RbsA [Verrucomicrobia subdivision 3 bacterium]|nr:Ribose import ATP-binding protein RbsA [Limisphaerales bacterium]MCS1412328.1 Ribose import ATP-binding protein RbsA [Limisphaerales bacterium]
MSGVVKSFGATRALRGVSFEVAPGEVHTLIGENGAGKSTLMKVLSGAHQADEGRIELDGEPFLPKNPLHARDSGIAMIYQELNLAPDLSVEENILLGEEPRRFGLIRRRMSRDLAQQALEQLDHSGLSLATPVYELSIAEQQLVEIARALTQRPRVLIMDEPTSSLTQVDVERLFRVIARLKTQGVSIVYISHFLEECEKVCDRYTVLRDGESVGTGEMDTTEIDGIIRLMVGREMKEIYPKLEHSLGAPALELEGLAGRKKPHSVSLKLRRGEIFGVAGLVGAGRTETLRTCFGLDRLTSGRVRVAGEESTEGTPRLRLRQGMGLLSENRKGEGLLLNQSIANNLTMTRFEPFSKFGFIRHADQSRAANQWIDRLGVRTSGARQTIGELSGGNQQKVAIGRLLHHDADILLFDEPTRGIDVGSKAQIYQLVNELAKQGKAILFVSSYLPELLGVCDTIGVMCRGMLKEVRPAEGWDEEQILAVAIGQDE